MNLNIPVTEKKRSICLSFMSRVHNHQITKVCAPHVVALLDWTPLFKWDIYGKPCS